MRKVIMSLLVACMCLGMVREASSAYYVEYYRDNLFLGLAYHRVGCLTDWTTIQDDQDYDGFTNKRYCYTGATADSVPDAKWYDWNYAVDKAQLDKCGDHANWLFDTLDYAERSDSCSYNILMDCNSDCWIRRFSSCQGWTVSTVSPCFGNPPNG